jgi:hypothetical protein
MNPRYLEQALPMMRKPSSQREDARWSVTIDTQNLGRLFRARYFLAGVLIGAAVLLPFLL